MWREKLAALSADIHFRDPASQQQIDDVERSLAVAVPSSLASLLSESDGVTGRYDLGLVWPTERIISDNRSFRSTPEFAPLYMPFEALLFFADAGNGDQFAFPITATGARDEVFVWDHETDSRRWYAGSFELYLSWWLSGEHPI